MNTYPMSFLFALIFLSTSTCIANEDESDLFDRKITTISSKDELTNHLEKMDEYTQADKAYAEEKEQKRNRVSTQSLNGLTADEIGDIPALTIGGDSSLYSLDTELKPYNEYFLALSYDSLYSIKPNQNSINAPEIISAIVLPKKEDNFSYKPLIIENDLLIVIREIQHLNYIELLSYNLNSDGEIQFNQRYEITNSNFGKVLEAKVVGDNLVFVTSSSLKNDNLTKTGLFLPITAIRYFDDSEEEVDIKSTARLINTPNDIRNWSNGYNLNYIESFKLTNVVNCPLDGLDKNSLECDMTSLLGVHSYSGNWFDINEDSVYIWSNSSPKLDYENLSINDYNDFIRSEEGRNLFNKVNNGDYHKIIYRVDLGSGQVGGILIDGAPASYGSLQGSAGAFSGIFSSKESNGVVNVNGARFELSDFSNQAKEPTSENSQNLIKSSEVWYRGPIENKAIMLSTSGVKGEEKVFVSSWDRETREFNQLNTSSNLHIAEVYVVANNLLLIGRDEKNYLVVETWSVDGADEVLDRFKIEKFAHEYTHKKDLYVEQQKEDYFFIIEAVLKNELDENTSQRVSWILPFIKSADGTLSNVGGFIPLDEDDCVDESLCFLSETDYKALVLEDYIYILVYGEIHKRKYSSEELVLLNRLDLSTGETITE